MTTAVGKVMQGTGAAMTKYTTPLIGVGVAAAKVGGDFEEQMSRVKLYQEQQATHLNR